MKDRQAFWGKALGWVLTIDAVIYVFAQHWDKLISVR